MAQVRQASANFGLQAEAASQLMEQRRQRLSELGVQFGEGAMVDSVVIPAEVVEQHGAEIAELIGLPEPQLRAMVRAMRWGTK